MGISQASSLSFAAAAATWEAGASMDTHPTAAGTSDNRAGRHMALNLCADIAIHGCVGVIWCRQIPPWDCIVFG